jgi:hypothetical protein
MPYTVQIDVLNPAPLDGVTPINFNDPAVVVTQNDDRFVISVPPANAFGFFDPGEVVGLPNLPYLMLAAAIAAPTMPFVGVAGVIRSVGPQASGALFATRKVLNLLGPGLAQGLLLAAPELIPFNNGLGFVTDVADPGPYRIVLTIEPFRDSKQPNGEDLPAAWAAGTLAT